MGSAVPASANPINEFVSLCPETHQPDSPDNNAGHLRRPAWIKPSNGEIEAGSVMGGAVSWPALSESTRPVCRLPSDPNRVNPLDGSHTSSQAPLISQPPQRQANTHSHANSSANNSTRPRSKNRGGSSGGGPSHNTFHRPSPLAPPLFPVYNAPYQPILDTPRPPGGVGRNTPRRGGNYGSRPRSDGPHHNNYRRHQDRRDINIPPPYMPPPPPPIGYMPSSPLPLGMPPFMGGPPLRIFPGQMNFEMTSPFMYVPQPLALPDPFKAMPIVTPSSPPITFSSSNENSLQKMIIKQIDYYFSDDNLAKDNYLRSKMDDYGWVPITLIANFQRVEQLTKDIQVILDAMRFSSVVELQGEKIRRRVAWNKWIHSSSRPNPQTTAIASA